MVDDFGGRFLSSFDFELLDPYSFNYTFKRMKCS